MTDEEFLRIKNYLKRRYGIDLSGKKTIMEGRLENYVKTHGFSSYSDFMNSVECDVTGKLEKK